MKKINYFGKEYEVSDEVEWVATNWRGAVMAFSCEPVPTDCRWVGGACDVLDRLPVGNAYWKDSLRQVKDIIVKENKLKVGDKVELLCDAQGFKKGQIVELFQLEDDGRHLFKGINSRYSNCGGEQGAYLTRGEYKPLDKKTFKIKCVDNKGSGHFTIGKEYDCFIIDESGIMKSECDFKHLELAYHGGSLDNFHGTFEMVDEYKAHPHADLMFKYAMIAQYDDKPWESFEFNNQYTHRWIGVADHPCWGAENEYRLKPQEPKIQIGQIWTSKEGVSVMIDTPTDAKTIYFSFTVFGCHYKNFAPISEFLQNFKRKE